MVQRGRQILVSLVLVVLLLVTSCAPKPPSQFDQAQQLSSQPGAIAVAKNATQGSEFNAFFPKPGNGYERLYTQEKKGFAEAKLKKDGKDLAMLAISDTSSIPSAAQKFQQSTQKIGGYPAVEIGSTQTAVLVGDRYQVKVLSRDPAFGPAERSNWIAKFDLNGLAKLN
ncbi:MAG: hypothetical protein KME35_03130 [Aphanocapsa sp. GSE-SYN-MK-11-07L]|jgi:hypothetical protein|nr:hypothetical protein [Aphanocapsa sp. GSE-SYN-MK-11-07L]